MQNLSIVTRTLIGILGRFLYWLFTLGTRAREYFDFKYKKSHKKHQVVLRSDEIASAKGIAVFALYPQMAMWNSVVRTISYLKESGFAIVLVVNQNEFTKRWVADLESFGVTVIVRPNIGHDFGAFQAGIAFLVREKMLEQCDRLLLLNDSVIVTPKSKELFTSFFARTSSWQCLTLSIQPTLHAQSYFQSFSSDVFRSRAFLDFWTNYYPTSLRNRVIQSGEVGLSKTLIAKGYLPNALTFDIRLDKEVLSKHELNFAEKSALFAPGGASTGALDDNYEAILNRISHELYERNPNQSLGIYLARSFGFPLKRDSLYSRLYSLADVLLCMEAAGISGDELEELKNLFMGTLVVRPGLLNALWRSIGLVR